jgi:acyl CoA:acetate/3-ketoacid CoA transferase alpha subunit
MRAIAHDGSDGFEVMELGGVNATLERPILADLAFDRAQRADLDGTSVDAWRHPHSGSFDARSCDV